MILQNTLFLSWKFLVTCRMRSFGCHEKSAFEKELERFGMNKNKVVISSLVGQFNVCFSQCLKSEKEEIQIIPCSYYAMVCTRSDIAHAFGVVIRYLFNTSKEHSIEWIFRYLSGISRLILCFGDDKPTLDGCIYDRWRWFTIVYIRIHDGFCRGNVMAVKVLENVLLFLLQQQSTSQQLKLARKLYGWNDL